MDEMNATWTAAGGRCSVRGFRISRRTLVQCRASTAVLVADARRLRVSSKRFAFRASPPPKKRFACPRRLRLERGRDERNVGRL
ncbi:hypothetical protein BIFGAL_03452 [Bifidobacterium gallicum DSM 20093 = LMG 11596]|uniref:Uncharacterized protein n=1 Tax=Bifidobacterium gallicum DSM 20093 = LMG 11596 TaxID=561180 RepID=D1NUC9_9BIFI|nr:hypothetical protein BIFGAL_03452 [Bifidobacterium gallicum DSM 20093 = LMG 11596]